VTRVSVGAEETVNAPDLKGYRLADTSPKRLRIERAEERNVVEFLYAAYFSGGSRGAVPELLNGDEHFRYLLGYEDGTLRPERSITREEIAAVFYRLLKGETRKSRRTDAHGFLDVEPARWSATEIGTMRKIGVVQGYPEGDYKPAQPVTRAEFAVIAARFGSADGGGAPVFSDIRGHWAEGYIVGIGASGWIDGYPDGTFQPNQAITRAEAAKIINRMLCRAVDRDGAAQTLMTRWPDLSEAHWAYYELTEATVSHAYTRRASDDTEDWTGHIEEIDFDID
jgi:hypothetical protein